MAEQIEQIILADLPEKVKNLRGLGQVSTRKLTPESDWVASVAWYWTNKTPGIHSRTLIVLDTESKESFEAANLLKEKMKEIKPRTKA